MASRVICGCSKFDHITDFTWNYIHLLPIQQRVDFKMCSMVYKALGDLSPSYVMEPPGFQDARTIDLHLAAT